MTHRIMFTMALGVLVVACGVEEASTGPSFPEADSGPVVGGGDAGGQMATPMVDPSAPSVCSDSVPLQGTAQPGASIIVFGGSSSAISTDAHPTTGRFCVDVPLVKDSENVLEIRAQDPVLGMSEPVMRTVTQNGSCGNDDAQAPEPDQPESKNVAFGAEAHATKLDQGNAGMVVDNNFDNYVRMKGGTGPDDADDWIYFKLDKLYAVTKIVIHWKDKKGSGDEYGKEYTLMTSDYSDPGSPKGNEDNGKWHMLKHEKNGDGGVDTIGDLDKSNTLVQWVALRPMHDGSNSILDFFDEFKIKEIEVWDKPQTITTQPTTTQNTCATISTGY